MKKITFLTVVLALLVSAGSVTAQEYRVVVNAANPATSISKDELSKIFLKQAQNWPQGGRVMPVDQSDGASVRDAFSRAVHGRSASAIAAHWQQQIFSGRDVPPEQVGSDQDVLDFVRSNPNAVGYVSAGAALGSGVKVLTVN